MRFRRTWGAAAIALALAGGLSGCVADTPKPVASTTPTVAPVFASEEEALAAATEAYAAYQHAVDDSLRSLDADQLASVATGDALLAARNSVDSFLAKGNTLNGDTIVSVVEFVHPPIDKGPLDGYSVYACLDVAHTSVVDSSDVVIVDNSKQPTFPMVVGLKYDSVQSIFLVDTEEVWDGANFCF